MLESKIENDCMKKTNRVKPNEEKIFMIEPPYRESGPEGGERALLLPSAKYDVKIDTVWRKMSFHLWGMTEFVN